MHRAGAAKTPASPDQPPADRSIPGEGEPEAFAHAMPIAANVFVLAERAGGDSRVIALAVVASTALAALSFPIASWLVTLWAGG